jgi:prealbumin domain-containing protein/uncharacterized protein DUF11
LRTQDTLVPALIGVVLALGCPHGAGAQTRFVRFCKEVADNASAPANEGGTFTIDTFTDDPGTPTLGTFSQTATESTSLPAGRACSAPQAVPAAAMQISATESGEPANWTGDAGGFPQWYAEDANGVTQVSGGGSGTDPIAVAAIPTADFAVVFRNQALILPTIALQKDLGGYFAPGDRFTLEIQGPPSPLAPPGTPSVTVGDGTTTGLLAGAGDVAQIVATPGTLYTLVETGAGSPPADLAAHYVTTIECVNHPGKSPAHPKSTSFTLTPGEGDVYVCTVTNTPLPQVNLGKSLSPGGFDFGVPATYTLTVTVTSGPTTEVTTVMDAVPAGLTLGTIDGGGFFSCSAAGQLVTCTAPDGLDSGTYAITLQVTPTTAGTSTFTNRAQVGGGGDPEKPAPTDPTTCTGNGTPAAGCAVLTSALNMPQLTLAKSASSNTFVIGAPASFTLQVTNTGTSPTSAPATIADDLPALLTPGTMPAGCAVVGQSVSCAIAPGLAAGQSVAFVIPVTPQTAPEGTLLTNTATVSGGGDPTCGAAAHCTGTATVTLAAAAAEIPALSAPLQVALALLLAGLGAATLRRRQYAGG